jgi:hypothetical protein
MVSFRTVDPVMLSLESVTGAAQLQMTGTSRRLDTKVLLQVKESPNGVTQLGPLRVAAVEYSQETGVQVDVIE